MMREITYLLLVTFSISGKNKFAVTPIPEDSAKPHSNDISTDVVRETRVEMKDVTRDSQRASSNRHTDCIER